MNKYTDQEFTYRQVPFSYDGIAKLDSIKGNTIVWNQLALNGRASVTGSGITFTNNNDGTWKVTGTATANVSYGVDAIGDRVNVVQGHKYYLRGCPSGGDDAKYYLELQGYARDKGTGVVFTAQSSTADVGLTLTVKNGVNLGTGITFVPQLFDLTLNETNNLDTFTSLFPLQKYAYGQYLLNFNGNAIKTTGKNLVDVADFTMVGTSTTQIITLSNFANILTVGTTYTLSFDAEATGDADVVFDGQPDSIFANKPNALGYDKRITTSTTKQRFSVTGEYLEGTTSFRFYRITSHTGLNQTINISNIQIEYGSSATDYEPYKTEVTSLPVADYFPTGLKSANTVYDELTPTKAITRIGEVDLGSLTWSLNDATNHVFEATITDMNPMANYQNNFNFASSMYTPSVLGKADMPNLSVRQASNSSNHIFLKNTSYSDANAFKTAMDGVMLYYELATPVEQDINADLFYKFYGGGTEEVLPTNGSIPTTTPLYGDIEYYTQFDSDVPYRKFWLVNGNGERWNFTEHELKTFLNNPNGLGFKKTLDLIRYGERAVKNSEVYDLPTVTGDLLFYDTANSSRYDRYNEFVRFLMDQPIKLYYQIPVSYSSQIADLYTLDCEVSELRKTESKPGRLLTSNITINGLSFYEGEEVVISGSSTTISIENKGDFAVGFEITIEGTMTNPYFTLEQDEELYGEGRFVDSTAFNSVYVNSNDGEQDLVLQQNGSILPNPLSYQDLSISNGAIYVTFVKLARGVSELKVRGGTISNVTVRFKPMFRSV